MTKNNRRKDKINKFMPYKDRLILKIKKTQKCPDTILK